MELPEFKPEHDNSRSLSLHVLLIVNVWFHNTNPKQRLVDLNQLDCVKLEFMRFALQIHWTHGQYFSALKKLCYRSSLPSAEAPCLPFVVEEAMTASRQN
jgi:short subunit fatty acids transporter